MNNFKSELYLPQFEFKLSAAQNYYLSKYGLNCRLDENLLLYVQMNISIVLKLLKYVK